MIHLKGGKRTESCHCFFEVLKVDVSSKVAFPWTVKDIHNFVIFECLEQCQSLAKDSHCQCKLEWFAYPERVSERLVPAVVHNQSRPSGALWAAEDLADFPSNLESGR
jgi:hypothetical protein